MTKPMMHVELLAPLHQAQIEALEALLGELTQVVPISSDVARLEIRVVPRHAVGSEANRLLGKEAYSALAPPHGAVILPIESEGRLGCVILIGVEEFDGLSEIHRPDGLVSSLLEELLHAQVYGVRWQRHGNFLADDASPEAGFEIIASRVHDEYVVCRAKNELASNLPLFDAPGMPGFRVQRVFTYDGNLSMLMSQTQRDVESLTDLFQEGKITPADLASHLAMGIGFRQIFEPLSRSHGFLDGMPAADQERFPLTPPDENFFQSSVAPHWQQIHGYLRESYASGLQGSLCAIRSIANEVRMLTQELERRIRFPQGG